MKKFKIAYLYYDLMNLYGENGNIRYLEKELKEQDLDVVIDYITIGDKIDTSYDFYYIGCGTLNNQLIVLKDITKYKKEFKDIIDSGKFVLVTGNAIELFGCEIFNEAKTYKGLEIFPYSVTISDVEVDYRTVGEQYYKTELVPHSIIGFVNKSSEIDSINNNTYGSVTDRNISPLFKVIDGFGYDYDNNKYDGVYYNNFYGTYLIGPLLVRNPYFTDYLIERICKKMGTKYKKNKRDGYEYLAYNEYLKNFYEKLNN